MKRITITLMAVVSILACVGCSDDYSCLNNRVIQDNNQTEYNLLSCCLIKFEIADWQIK